MKVRLLTSKREPLIEFTMKDYDENQIDLIEYTDQCGNKTYHVFVDKTDDDVVVYRGVRKVTYVKWKLES